jgi:hypothetical protein
MRARSGRPSSTASTELSPSRASPPDLKAVRRRDNCPGRSAERLLIVHEQHRNAPAATSLPAILGDAAEIRVRFPHA